MINHSLLSDVNWHSPSWQLHLTNPVPIPAPGDPFTGIFEDAVFLRSQQKSRSLLLLMATDVWNCKMKASALMKAPVCVFIIYHRYTHDLAVLSCIAFWTIYVSCMLSLLLAMQDITDLSVMVERSVRFWSKGRKQKVVRGLRQASVVHQYQGLSCCLKVLAILPAYRVKIERGSFQLRIYDHNMLAPIWGLGTDSRTSCFWAMDCTAWLHWLPDFPYSVMLVPRGLFC